MLPQRKPVTAEEGMTTVMVNYDRCQRDIGRPAGGKKVKEVLAPFSTPELAFYNGSIGWRGKEIEFYVMHLLTWQLQYINFQESTFQKSDFLGEKSWR